jgi:hypothetical protein
MTAQLLDFRPPAPPPEATAQLLAAVVELHALIAIDPVMGASPSRTYFVFNPVAKARVAAAIDRAEAARARPPTAFAVTAYNFPFALHLIGIAARPISPERARTIASASADLQSRAFQAAANAVGVGAQLVTAFDAEALTTAFFPGAQETVINLFRLELQG